MAHFITIDFCKRINLDHVERIVEHVDGRGNDVTTFYGRGGESLGTSKYQVDWDEQVARVIPAAPGTAAVVVFTTCDKDARPTEADIQFYREPVIAWRLTSPYLTPIFLEQTTYAAVLIELPDGRLKSQGDCTYDNIEEAIEGVLDGVQACWDYEHRDKIARVPMKESAE